MFNKRLFTLLLSVWGFAFLAAPLQAATLFPNGTLLKGELAEIFLVDAEEKLRWIPNETTFEALGYDWSAVVTVEDAVLYQYKFGEPLTVIKENKIAAAPDEIEAKVRKLFADVPIMISVAKCESGFRQFRSDDSLLRSSNGLYIGVFQIDENIHGKYASNLGMDIKTVDGNLAYAKHLYNQRGVQPWSSCAYQSAPIRNDLKLGDRSLEVKTLQKILNQAGYPIASTGPGSAGNETEYFGFLTREAVKKFQCDRILVCDGAEDTTGYGMIGSRTRAALAAIN